MLDSLFNTELPLLVKVIIAFAVVLALLAAVMWLLRRFGGDRLGQPAQRGRQPRLAVIDAAAIDSRRRLVLLRRDNVEHLVMIGGPSDVLIEQNIIRAVPVQPPRETPSQRPSVDMTGRGGATDYPTRVPNDALRAPAEPVPRGTRAEAAPRSPRSEAPPRRPADYERPRSEPAYPPRASAAPDTGRASRAPVPPARAEPDPYASDLAPPPPLPPPAPGEPNLSTMAHKLEAALRRPGMRPAEAADAPPLNEPTPPTAPEFGASRASPRDSGPRDSGPRDSGPPARDTSLDRPPSRSSGPVDSGKSMFDSLEEEMASLLGRPGDPTEKK